MKPCAICAAYEEIEKHSILEGPLIAEEDENGVVHLRRKDGTPVAMMNRVDWDAFRAWAPPTPKPPPRCNHS